MKPRHRQAKPAIPLEVAYALRYGKGAYLTHPGYAEATEDAFDVYLVCGILIHCPKKARALWMRYREALLKRADISSWWAFREYENKHV